MCGIVAIVSYRPVNQDLYDALTVLQHRGQEISSIVTCEDKKLHFHTGNGLASHVFTNTNMLKLKGNMGIAYVSYLEKIDINYTKSHPFYVNYPFGLSIAYDGNLTNRESLIKALTTENYRHINTESDSEVLLNVLAHELQNLGKSNLSVDDVFQAISCVHRRCRGAYAVVVMISGVGILGFRDPNGIRPIVYGARKTDLGPEFILASESVTLDTLGFELIRDVKPGEAVFIEESGVFYTKQCADCIDHYPCIFEYIRLARPDSIIDRISVYKARLRMGEKLAEKVKRDWPDHDIDVVMSIPDVCRTSALQMAAFLDITHREGFIKNHYMNQSFIINDKKITKNIKKKLNTINIEFEGKNVLLVDDSIISGRTSSVIIQMARNAGAIKVYFASIAPPIRYPNVYGINMLSSHEFIAYNRTENEVCIAIGADRIIYQDLNDLIDAVRIDNNIKNFDTSCFSNEYITGYSDSVSSEC